MHTKALPFVFLLSFFWGTNIVASRYGVGEFDPYFFVALRIIIAASFFVPFVWFQRGGLPTDLELWKKAGISGIIGVAIPMPMFIMSLQYQSSGVASLYVTLFPVMIAIAAHFILPDEKMTRYKAAGVFLALCGAVFLALRGESGLADVGRANPLGFILVMLSLLTEVGNTMFVRLKMKDTDPVEVTVIRLIVAAVFLSIVTNFVSDVTFEGVTQAGVFSLAYAALIGALAGQFMAFFIQRKYGATAFSLTSFMIPVVATLFGALLLGEILTWAMGVGVLFIGGGLYLINYVKSDDSNGAASQKKNAKAP